MKLPKLYVETTIPSYLTARRSQNLRLAAHQEVTAKWWKDYRLKYDLYTSAYVRAEAAEGNSTLAAARLALLDGIPVLPTTYEVESVAEMLLKNNLIPNKAATDALSHFHCGSASHRLSAHLELHPHSQPEHYPASGTHMHCRRICLSCDLQP